MAGDLRATVAGAYAELENAALLVSTAGAYAELNPAQISVTAAGAYAEIVKTEIKVTVAGVYAEIEVITDLAYRVKDTHDQLLTEDDDVVPQPRSAGVRVTRRTHSASGGVLDEFLYVELLFSSLGSVSEYQSLLTQFGVLSADENEVTVLCRDHAFRWRRYNGTAVRPQQGVDVQYGRYFARDVVILVKFLELIG